MVYGAPITGDKIIAQKTAPYSSGNTTSEIVAMTLAVPEATFSAGDVIEIFAGLQMNNSGGIKTFRFYVCEVDGTPGSAVPAEAVKIATSSDYSGVVSASFSRYCPLFSLTKLRALAADVGKVASQYGTSGDAPSDITYEPKFDQAFWVIISVQKATGTDVANVNSAFVARKKS